MKQTFTLIAIIIATAEYVAAHGYVKTVTIAGTAFQANHPFGGNGPSGIRKVSDVLPIKGAKNPDVQCGINAQPASQVLSANPGDVMTIDWRGADGSFWPHDMGPLQSFMASCGNTTCDKFDMTQAKWFKIDEVGQKPGGKGWYQEDLMTGGVASATIPNNIAAGQYLFRHEIIALHLANDMGGAEFYASCTQLNIGGSGIGTPSPNELVSIPGVYSDDDEGIYTPAVFNPGFQYKFPRPPISKLAVVTSNGTASTTAGSTGPSSTTTSSSGGNNNRTNNNISQAALCHLRKSDKSSIHRRNLSRLIELITGIGSNKH